MLETVYGFSTRFHNNYMYKDKNNLYLERIIIRANFFFNMTTLPTSNPEKDNVNVTYINFYFYKFI